MTTEMARFRVNLTITKGLEQALMEKAATQNITIRDATHDALMDWAARPIADNRTTELTMLKEVAEDIDAEAQAQGVSPDVVIASAWMTYRTLFRFLDLSEEPKRDFKAELLGVVS